MAQSGISSRLRGALNRHSHIRRADRVVYTGTNLDRLFEPKESNFLKDEAPSKNRGAF